MAENVVKIRFINSFSFECLKFIKVCKYGILAVAVVGNVGLHLVDLIGNSVEEHLLAKRYHSVVVAALGAAAFKQTI